MYLFQTGTLDFGAAEMYLVSIESGHSIITRNELSVDCSTSQFWLSTVYEVPKVCRIVPQANWRIGLDRIGTIFAHE